MREVRGLVSWNQPEDHGKVPDSEWLCPGDFMPLLDAAESGQPITDQLIRELGGRTHHLVEVTYPEGYHAYRIIDSETGQVMTDGKDSKRYRRDDTNSTVHALIPALQQGKPLLLSGSRQVAVIDNRTDKEEGTLSVITPVSAGQTYLQTIHGYIIRAGSTLPARACRSMPKATLGLQMLAPSL